jgi:hypothetical protein
MVIEISENYKNAIEWANTYIQNNNDSSLQLKQGVLLPSIHNSLIIHISRIENSRGFAQSVAFRRIKDIKDKLMTGK